MWASGEVLGIMFTPRSFYEWGLQPWSPMSSLLFSSPILMNLNLLRLNSSNHFSGQSCSLSSCICSLSPVCFLCLFLYYFCECACTRETCSVSFSVIFHFLICFSFSIAVAQLPLPLVNYCKEKYFHESLQFHFFPQHTTCPSSLLQLLVYLFFHVLL